MEDKDMLPNEVATPVATDTAPISAEEVQNKAVSEEIKGKVKAELEQMSDKEKEIAGSASERIEFISAIKGKVRTSKGSVTMKNAPCAVRLKNIDSAPVQVPVIPYTVFNNNAQADFANIGTRTISGGQTFILTLPEFGFLVKDIAYLGKVKGNGKGVGFSYRPTSDPLPTPMLTKVGGFNPLDGAEVLSFEEVLGSEAEDYKSLQGYFLNKATVRQGNKAAGVVAGSAVNAISYAELAANYAKSQSAE